MKLLKYNFTFIVQFRSSKMEALTCFWFYWLEYRYPCMGRWIGRCDTEQCSSLYSRKARLSTCWVISHQLMEEECLYSQFLTVNIHDKHNNCHYCVLRIKYITKYAHTNLEWVFFKGRVVSILWILIAATGMCIYSELLACYTFYISSWVRP